MGVQLISLFDVVTEKEDRQCDLQVIWPQQRSVQCLVLIWRFVAVLNMFGSFTPLFCIWF